MANDFFKKMASAFVEFKEEEVQVATVPTTPKPTVVVSNPTAQNNAEVQQSNTVVLDQDLMNKLCEELENVNLPGPDYQELKTAASDEDVVSIVSDPEKRFILAYKTLKAAHPNLNKQHILDSIDVYINHLKKCEREALEDINAKRAEIQTDVNKVNELTSKIAEYQSEIQRLQININDTTDRCTKNENNMVSHVAFLIDKLQADKASIDKVIKD